MRRLALPALLALAALAAGCTMPERLALGTPRAQVLAKLGTPTLTAALPDAGERLLYSRQPAGQQVYHVDLDAQRRVARVEQVLTLEQFQALRLGQDTREEVRLRFGPPALVERVARFDGDIWTYRILELGEPRQAHVHIDPAGVVRQVLFTDERRGEPDSRAD
ncbi:hypothetical protein [Pulveribacter suum]|uniref:Lipoprotein transmembrane n=1 Tax=Pulveribacter suum TaxID=2116657 RepID=A0A2P1NHI2_9BURK|nr:hypothetical protein [Pulveribacter suum]AVP56498.1 hypothetical protein C7H73_01610 [Pulveribacter suum]